MLNKIWLGMIFLAVIVGFTEGRIDDVVRSVTESARLGFNVALALTAVMALWLGIFEIASQSGVMRLVARALQPAMRRLFPDVPTDDPAMGAMALNIAANMLGFANAATPFGLEAMKALHRLNNHARTASDAMCTFLAVNTSSVQLIPTTAMALLAANGSLDPSCVVLSTLIATSVSTVVGIISVKQLAKLPMYRRKTSNELDVVKEPLEVL